MRRISLGLQMFLSILGVALFTAVVVGVFARRALSQAFDVYLQTTPMGANRPRMGRMMLGAAEQSFVGSIDRSVIVAGAIALAIATIVAILLAAYLARPLRRLESATEILIGGDLGHRVEVDGPSEVASLGSSFNRMADSLERAENLRRRMVADVAHELRNPLAAALAQAEGMADGVIAADERRLESVVEDLKHLSALVSDLQELAVADAGRLRYDMAELDLSALALREAERIRPLLRDAVSLQVDAAVPGPTVHGDERRLAQVMRNLLSNAARHTAAGSVRVTVGLEDDSVVVRVADTGEGIAADEIEHIFERFYRADAARAADTGGAGLGLAISRATVLDHGGDMFARSRPGEGTEIGFLLPI